MTKNKELFAKDPTTTKIPNEGVTEVIRPETPAQWEVLEWELSSFVCEGEYARGMDRILNSYLTNLGEKKQPAAWVSGFYGSGKSHLCRVLEYLWRDVELPSGQQARQMTDLPPDIRAQFVELSTQGKRHGGLWSAAGRLSTGREVNLAFLSVLFGAAGLPEQYPLASFVLWAEREGYADHIRAKVEEEGRDFNEHLANLYASPIIANALLELDPTLGDSIKDVRDLLRDQFPPKVDDLTLPETMDATELVLKRQSDTDGEYPLTLIVLDEMQQFLGDDNKLTLDVQDLVEAVSSGFDNTVLFVTTGQSAMGGTPTLQKLTDRFPLQVALSDKDVETVVRQVILRKKPDKQELLGDTLERASGEINRHLGGTSIAPRSSDKDDLNADYPLLPTRRRFWELALRALDRAGKAGVLRTQLRIVHEATRTVAEDPAGHVIGADFLYDQQAPSLQQSGALLKEISESILELQERGPDGELKSRIAALVFLINAIPKQMIGQGEIGLRATPDYLADLLVEDLIDGGPEMRKRVPELLEDLTASGTLMRVDDEYRLQTEEGAEWEKDYRGRYQAIRDDAAKIARLRNERLLTAVDAALGDVRLTQGVSNTARKVKVHFGSDEPTADGAEIPVWVRDEWSVTAAAHRNAAAQAGSEDAVVHVLLPKQNPDAIRDALASLAAAQETVHAKPTPATDEGKEALRAMRGRVEGEQERLTKLFDEVVSNGTVLQGGGNEVDGATLRDAVETAARNSLIRLFQKFDMADNANWGKVVNNARDGAPDALSAVGFDGSPLSHPVVKEVFDTVSAAGTTGAAVRARFMQPPYGWEEDVVRGSLLVLLATGHVRAEQNSQPLSGPKQLEPRKITTTTFYEEDPPPTMEQRLAMRGLLAAADIAYEANQEAANVPALLQKLIDLADDAGGQPPLPPTPDVDHIKQLQQLAGNDQFKQVADEHDRLKAQLDTWRKAAKERELRLRAWERLQALLRHARDLPVADEVEPQVDAIKDGRQLLNEPDPVRPLIDQLIPALRESVEALDEQLRAHFDRVREELQDTDEWDKLPDETWQKIIREVDLQKPTEVNVSTQEALLELLADRPISAWRDHIEVLDARAKRARELAAKELEPTARRVTTPAATLKSEGDVDAYLDELRGLLMEHIGKGDAVII